MQGLVLMKILFVTRVGDGIGYGHFKRTTGLAKQLIRGEKFELSFLVETSNVRVFEGVKQQLQKSLSESKNPIGVFSSVEELGESFHVVFVDRMKTQMKCLLEYMRLGPVVGLDEGGDARVFFPYLIDALQEDKDNRPNLFSYSFMGIGEKKTIGVKKIKLPPERILVSFGGEDPYELSLKFLRAVRGYVEKRRDSEKFLSECSIEIVVGPLFSDSLRKRIEKVARNTSLNIRVLKAVEDVMALMENYDLVITSYGITAYEALGLGVPPVLFNPTSYHGKLAKNIGFYDIGVGKPLIKKLVKLISNRQKLEEVVIALQKKIRDRDYSVERFLDKFSFTGQLCCPICGELNYSLMRFRDRTYFKCARCGLVYLANWESGSFFYDERYFFEDYKKQYGKTYLEDFGSIKRLGKKRLEIIKRYMSKRFLEGAGSKEGGKLRLLDVGCAYGAFLQAASEEGFRVVGVDLSCDAVRYVENNLHLEAECGDFIEVDFFKRGGDEKFDVVTMWYVIEHLRELPKALEKVSNLLRRGGIFAFSTPNLYGISGRRNLEEFLKKSPKDHFFIFSHESAEKILSEYGFKVLRFSTTGIHPERFPFYRPLLRHPYRVLGRYLRLGDTFEVFAEKV